MLVELTTIGSNVVVVGIVVWMVRTSTQREIDTATKFTERPDFEQMDKRIDKAIKAPCSKIRSLREDFNGHAHEGSKAKVTLK